MNDPVETARAHWGANMPDWIDRLARECAASSQSRVAQKLGRSAAVVSSALRAKYAGDMGVLEDLVRGIYMDGRVQCPELGTIPSNQCQDHRAKSRRFSSANPLRVRMFQACNRCTRNIKEG